MEKNKKLNLIYWLLEVTQYSIIFALLAFPFAKVIDFYSDFLNVKKSLFITIKKHPIAIKIITNQYFLNIDLVHSLLPHIGKLFFDINHFFLKYSTK